VSNKELASGAKLLENWWSKNLDILLDCSILYQVRQYGLTKPNKEIEMNKQQWIKKINQIKAEGSKFCELHWNEKDWQCWNDGKPTRDQKAMIAACQELDVVAMPGDMSPTTISFSGL
jgi:hypothetical protein